MEYLGRDIFDSLFLLIEKDFKWICFKCWEEPLTVRFDFQLTCQYIGNIVANIKQTGFVTCTIKCPNCDLQLIHQRNIFR